MLAADTNADGALSLPEFASIFGQSDEITEQLQQRFRRFRRSDGRIDHSGLRGRHFQMKTEELLAVEIELENWEVIRRLHTAAAQLVELCDQNSDGAISFEESAAIRGLDQLREDDLQTLVGLDADQNGSIALSEITEGLKSLVDVQFVSPAMAVDANTDGVVSPQEYALSIPDPDGTLEPSGLTAYQQQLFEEEDHDNNGEITRAEMTLTIMQIAVQRIECTVVMCWVFRMDADNSGTLSPAEFLKLVPNEPTAGREEMAEHFARWMADEKAEAGLTRDQLDRSLAFTRPEILLRLHALSRPHTVNKTEVISQ